MTIKKKKGIIKSLPFPTNFSGVVHVRPNDIPARKKATGGQVFSP